MNKLPCSDQCLGTDCVCANGDVTISVKIDWATDEILKGYASPDCLDSADDFDGDNDL